ncbi:hydrophobin [Puccinia graminis f. sp. tritici]|uniref:Hydrophobin n=1 Tax=Puccinia graminis f. sp. tritici TaxID=56615 RepID=A0A5B0MTM3_PUCGR|nr:hydrophobin [Puccinia graminis f. sp. tritici]
MRQTGLCSVEMGNDFNIIYVAPEKALAAEIVRKTGKRLGWLVGNSHDMQLTRDEINATHHIVTTPEKWDAVTRKSSGEEGQVARVGLIIIDEVHLLHEDRGAVIETIVARTLRQVQSSQSLSPIVGRSATLPNYVDVSDFLRINRMQGLFFFDISFRPVPPEQYFVVVRGKPNSATSTTNLDKATFEKDDPLQGGKRHTLIDIAAKKLRQIGMIGFDQETGSLHPTELGRITFKYCIKHSTINIFHQLFLPKMTNADPCPVGV